MLSALCPLLDSSSSFFCVGWPHPLLSSLCGLSPQKPLHNKLRLQLVLKGINWIKPHQRCPHLPVTPMIMSSIQRALEKKPGFDSTMLWAACCIGFLRFIRSGEFTLPTASAYDEKKHLPASYIAVDSHSNPTTLEVTLKFSKTDQFGRGTTIYIGQTPGPICQSCSKWQPDLQPKAHSLLQKKVPHSPKYDLSRW